MGAEMYTDRGRRHETSRDKSRRRSGHKTTPSLAALGRSLQSVLVLGNEPEDDATPESEVCHACNGDSASRHPSTLASSTASSTPGTAPSRPATGACCPSHCGALDTISSSTQFSLRWNLFVLLSRAQLPGHSSWPDALALGVGQGMPEMRSGMSPM